MRIWIKDPIAILAEDAGCGVVVDDGRIVELVARGAGPAARVDYVFDASRHMIPGLVNRTTDVTCSELISGTRMVNDRKDVNPIIAGNTSCHVARLPILSSKPAG